MKVAVIGATGALGRHVVPRLLERGHQVRVSSPSAERVARLSYLGVEPCVADLFERDSLSRAVEGCDAVLHIATAVPRPGAEPDFERNNRIRTDGTANLLDVCRAAGVRRYLQQSIAWVCSGADGGWSDETSPYGSLPQLEATIKMEQQVKASCLDWRIVRGGSFYGPGTGAEEAWHDQALAGTLTVPGEGDDYISLIHVTDMAAAVVAAVEIETSRVIVNVVDDAPTTYRAFYDLIAAWAGASRPSRGGSARLPSFRARNSRARELLGWYPHHSTCRSGLAAACR